jgi:hypothetical protein
LIPIVTLNFSKYAGLPPDKLASAWCSGLDSFGLSSVCQRIGGDPRRQPCVQKLVASQRIHSHSASFPGSLSPFRQRDAYRVPEFRTERLSK